MLRKIILENFMSHTRTEIDLADGLTVLTGPNNCGKSAVVAALQILATNGKSKHVLRHGEKKCRITVETDDGHVICWERSKTVVKYTVNGEDIHRVGTSIPDSLHELLRLDQVETRVGKSTHEYDIHFGEQKSPVFLLGESGSRAASFFASSSDAARLVEMQHRHRSKLTAKRSEAKRLRKDFEHTQARLNDFKPLDEIAPRLKSADSLAKNLHESDTLTGRLKQLAKQLQTQSAKVDELSNQCQILNRLNQTQTTPDSLQKADDAGRVLAAAIGEITALNQRQTKLQSTNAALNALEPVPSMHDTKSAKSLIEKLLAAARSKQRSRAELACCQPIKPPPQREPEDELRRLLDRLTKTTDEHNRLKWTSQTLLPLSPVPQLSDTARLGELLASFHDARQRVSTTASIHKATADLSEPPAQKSPARLRGLVEGLTHQQQQADKLTACAASLKLIQQPIDVVSNAEISETIQAISQQQEAVKKAREHFQSCQQKLTQAETEVTEFVQENPRCATCGSEIDPQTLLAGVPGIHRHQPTATDSDGVGGSEDS